MNFLHSEKCSGWGGEAQVAFDLKKVLLQWFITWKGAKCFCRKQCVSLNLQSEDYFYFSVLATAHVTFTVGTQHS